jgi:hypothetical protein
MELLHQRPGELHQCTKGRGVLQVELSERSVMDWDVLSLYNMEVEAIIELITRSVLSSHYFQQGKNDVITSTKEQIKKHRDL